MLSKKDAKDEYAETLRIRPVINKIPNNQKYFLVQDVTLCKPSILTESDKRNFSKCRPLEKIGLKASNINSNLNKVDIINFPYGGKDLNKLFNTKMNVKTFALINHKLLSLIKNAIIPMNKANLLHNDVKDANILFNDLDNELRLIDWGFGENIKKTIPTSLLYRPLQYNVPFTNTLLGPTFNTFYTKKLEELKKPISIFDVKTIVIEYFYARIKDGGHYRYLFEYVFPYIFHNINKSVTTTDAKYIIHFTFGLNIIIDYLTDALMNYTDFTKNKFDATKYFLNVYSKNVDIWGVLTSYIAIILAIEDNSIILETSKMKKEILQLIRNIVIKYLYSSTYASKTIDINVLEEDMKKINKLLGIKINDTQTKEQKVEKTLIDKEQKIILHTSSKKKGDKSKKTRCPNGTHRNKKTGNCEKI